MVQGVRSGLRIILQNKQVMTEVKDSDDVSYHICSTQMLMNQKWVSHHFALAAANTVDISEKTPAMLITDIDIDSIKVSVPDRSLLKSPDEQLQEKNYYLLQKHRPMVGQDGENADIEYFDEHLLFELNIANEVASQQSKSLAFLKPEDDLDEILFKHHMTLRRFEYNIGGFNEQLSISLREEEEFESHMMSSSQLTET